LYYDPRVRLHWEQTGLLTGIVPRSELTSTPASLCPRFQHDAQANSFTVRQNSCGIFLFGMGERERMETFEQTSTPKGPR
jgi:hypothetical protein